MNYRSLNLLLHISHACKASMVAMPQKWAILSFRSDKIRSLEIMNSFFDSFCISEETR